MKKFKYYSVRDKSKEIVGIVEAKNTSDAISKAATKKDLSWKNFMKMFNVEEVKNERKD
tara:strand:+ start:867 stop:1043 length:177 start_codon:yes stop_codon:yes gene_type:complete